MANSKQGLYFIAALALCLLILVVFLATGTQLQAERGITQGLTNIQVDYVENFKLTLKDNMLSPISLFLLQLVIIIAATKTTGYLFKKIGLPGIVGEIVAGILLGPSVLGAVFPSYIHYVFPKGSTEDLNLFSRLGLMLFVFIVGLQLNFPHKSSMLTKLKNNSLLFFPFLAGVILAYITYADVAPIPVLFIPFALFVGMVFSVAAYPLFLFSKQNEPTHDIVPVGQTALANSAINNVGVWCMLAIVIAAGRSAGGVNTLVTIGIAILFVVGMFKMVRPLLHSIYEKINKNNFHSTNTLVMAFSVLLLASLFTRFIGIHSLFGAFIAGAIMPRNLAFRKFVTDRTEYIAVILLLPLFIAYSGLRTHMELLNSSYEVTIVLILLAAVLGSKLLGSFLLSKYGQAEKDVAIGQGTLIDTTGLIELIILNIGLGIGVFSVYFFTILVVVCILSILLFKPLQYIISKRYSL